MNFLGNINNLEISLFDVVLAFFIIIFAIKGSVRGFISEFSKIFGWVIGLILATRFRSEVGEFIDSNIYKIDGSILIPVVGFFSILSVFLLLIFLLNSFLTYIAEKITILTIINKFFGAFLGGAKVFLLVSIIFGALYGIPLTKKYIFERYGLNKTFFYPFLVQAGAYVLNIEYLDDLNKLLPSKKSDSSLSGENKLKDSKDAK